MNFFDAQDRARRATRWLVIVYVIATVLIVAGVTGVVGGALYIFGTPGQVPTASVLVLIAAFTTLLILGSTAYKTAALSAGGSRVASDMGGTPVAPDVQDPLRRRLRNVVEEMAIASGSPVPDIYVLEAEEGINAFAAGYSPDDAAIAVTRGALDTLDRDELQGVIAHEFSHILNGDMRINIRMMGVLFGIMVLSIIGRIVLRGGYHGGAMGRRRNRGAPAIVAIGAGLALLGWIGVILARLIKAGVSRQRESLADASAVQFTRQSQGLADALKKIGGYSQSSYIRSVDPEEVSHMLFAKGSRRLTSLFATHPPLVRRIQALDPSFREEDFAAVSIRQQEVLRDAATGMTMSISRAAATEAAAGRAAAPLAARGESGGEPDTGPPAAIPVSTTADSIADSVGNPDHEQLQFARRLRDAVPVPLYDAAHSQHSALLLTLALVLDRSGTHLDRQLHVISEQLGHERTSLVTDYYRQLQEAGPQYALPLLEISFPALKKRPVAQLQFLVDLVRRLAETDGDIALYEYCLYRVLSDSIRRSSEPQHSSTRRVSQVAARRAALALLRVVADCGHEDGEVRDAAYRAGAARLGTWAAAGQQRLVGTTDGMDALAGLDRSLDVLQQLSLAGRRSLVQAVAEIVTYDRRIVLAEAELLRAICLSLECPLPPVVHGI